MLVNCCIFYHTVKRAILLPSPGVTEVVVSHFGFLLPRTFEVNCTWLPDCALTFFVMQICIIFALLLSCLVPPFLGALGSCPSRLPLDPPLLKSGQVAFFQSGVSAVINGRMIMKVKAHSTMLLSCCVMQMSCLVPAQKPISWASLAGKSASTSTNQSSAPAVVSKPQAAIKPERKAESTNVSQPLPQRLPR